MKEAGRVFLDTVKKSRGGAAVLCLSFAVCAAVFGLYGLAMEPFLYAAVLVVLLALLGFLAAFLRGLKKEKERQRLLLSPPTELHLPPPETLAEREYAEIIRRLCAMEAELRREHAAMRQEEVDYYTTWVHQIKTPISVMRMELGGEETPSARALEAELFRIEQYVDMVLTYLRLGGEGNDLVIREYPLDPLIRDAVHKFAPMFVAKRLSLRIEGTEKTVVTDKKWFACILEQLLSNAIKYTPSGTVSVVLSDGVLSVSDTGIGIAPEDLPRIFEKGYTGVNGRIDRRASGLGLYLCKKAADLVGIPLSAESTVGKGSRFSLDLNGKLREKPVSPPPSTAPSK